MSTLSLDPVAFPDASTLQQNANLGRLTVTNTLGKNSSGKYEALYVFGARSFSIWTADGVQVFDSRDEFEQIIADRFPENFNAENAANDFDTRSDNKGPEPEDVFISRAFGRLYAFITLERIGGVMIYDVTNPKAVSFVDYVNSRDFTVPVCDEEDDDDCEQGSVPNTAVGDLGPEIAHFITAENNPNGKPLLAVANEISGTTTLFEVVQKTQLEVVQNP